MKLMVINGPNLNMLGIREPQIYGKDTYTDLIKYINEISSKENVDVTIVQSNHEGQLVDYIQSCYFEGYDGIIINPGAYTHTSIALLDAIKAVDIPTVEVHLSDVSKREEFRQVSYVSLVAIARIMGKGFYGYHEAIKILKERLEG